MVRRNITKLIMTVILIIVLSVLVYRNYVYYLIPYNPLKEYYNTAPYDVYYTLYTNENPRGYSMDTDHFNTNDNNDIIFEYFKNLKLVPLSRNEYRKVLSHIKNPEDRIVYSFEFENNGGLMINDIFLDNLEVMRISGDNIPQYHEGYFRIIDGKMDYNYISQLMKGNKD